VKHICIEVDHINEALKTLRAAKVRALDPEPKIGAHGKRAFRDCVECDFIA
jgi:methylmalonyl-CoA/ethylmalonyl-CoA epimerase